MDILIPDEWLREFLDTPATPGQIGKYLSLCGPSVERIEKAGKTYIYHIEITTNRIDTASVYGIAREASVILPQFGIKANLKKLQPKTPEVSKQSLPLTIRPDKNLVYRTTGVVIDDIKNWISPPRMKSRLENSGVRSLNSIVDITNYVMLEVGHPMHAFDYDKIPDATLIIRESKKGEKIVSLDDKKYSLQGGDIIFESTRGEIIDLSGIIGTKNSVVSKDTKRVLLFIDNNDPARIRKSSMSLAIRTYAATLNEKGVDPELGMTAILRAIELSKEIASAHVVSPIHDNYVSKTKSHEVITTLEFIEKRLGIAIEKGKVTSILQSLEFEPRWSGDTIHVKVPSFRNKDITIPEDIVEEVARIFGYHNLPSRLMGGQIPETEDTSSFPFEKELRENLAALGGTEIYTLSLVSQKDVAGKKALKIKNPLGKDSEYLRVDLNPSLVGAAIMNKGNQNSFHLFEMANIYVPQSRELPEERLMLAGIFSGFSWREAKGMIETLLEKLNIPAVFTPEDYQGYLPSQRITIKIGTIVVGKFGTLEENQCIYYEFDIKTLRKYHKEFRKYQPLPKYPAQIEDLTLIVPERTKIGEVLESVKSSDSTITSVELKELYKDSYTIRILYQDPQKTLDNKEVENIRTKILTGLKEKYGISQKS